MPLFESGDSDSFSALPVILFRSYGFVRSRIEDRLRESERMTIWVAPDLGCFALRIRSEQLGPDGAFHTVHVKQAIKVTLNPR